MVAASGRSAASVPGTGRIGNPTRAILRTQWKGPGRLTRPGPMFIFGRLTPPRSPSARVRPDRGEVFHLPGDGQRQDLPQLAAAANLGPVLEDPLGLPAAGPGVVVDDQR